MIDFTLLGKRAAVALKAARAVEPQDTPPGSGRGSGNPVIDELVVANHILHDQGVIDVFGHVSVRHPTTPGHFYLARSMAPGAVGAEDILEFDPDANALDAQGRSLYSERYIHSEIYRRRPDVGAVVHSHSPGVIPFGVTGVPLQPISVTAPFLHTGVPIYDPRDSGSSDMLVRTAKLGEILAAQLSDHAVALMRGHGDVVVGPTLRMAVMRAVYTEINARLQTQAIILAAGAPINFLSQNEAAKIEASVAKEVPGSGRGGDRAWEMWQAELAMRRR